MIFLFLNKTRCGYSLEVPQRGTSNEYPHHMFLLRNKKNIDSFWTEFLYSGLIISDNSHPYF